MGGAGPVRHGEESVYDPQHTDLVRETVDVGRSSDDHEMLSLLQKDLVFEPVRVRKN